MNDKFLPGKERLCTALIATTIYVLSIASGAASTSTDAQAMDMKTRIAAVEAVSDECKVDNPSSLGLRTCAFEELEAWDKELNVAYRLLMGVLGTDAAKAELRSVQRAWLSYRDAEFEFIESKYAQLSGSMYPRLIAVQKIPIVKNRVRRLSLHLKSREF